MQIKKLHTAAYGLDGKPIKNKEDNPVTLAWVAAEGLLFTYPDDATKWVSNKAERGYLTQKIMQSLTGELSKKEIKMLVKYCERSVNPFVYIQILEAINSK